MSTKRKPTANHSIRTYGAENRKAAREKKQREKKIKAITALVLVLAVIIFIIFQVFFGKNAYNVMVGQNVVCTIDKTNLTSDDILNTATASLSKDLNTNVRIKDEITLQPVHASSKDMVTVEYAVTKVKEAASYEVEAGIIMIDNKKTVVLETKTEAENLLESIKGKFAPENADVTKCTFEQNVSTVTDFVDSSEILTFEEAYKKLTYTTEQDDVYTIAQGDSVWSVANKFGMTIDDLKSLNSMTSDTLKIGQEIKVKKQVPFLTVKYNP